jgi:hypothetical protein
MLTSMHSLNRERADGGRWPEPEPEPEPDAKEMRRLALERIVEERAREFEASALMQVLGELGYADRDIILRSRFGYSRPHSLIHAVEFERLPKRRVLVTVNLGLLVGDTPLPSYISRIIENSPERMVPFFEYFDHVILRSRIRSFWPERDPELGANWNDTRRSMSKLVRLDSPAMGHWLFRRIYPELEVAVRRQPSRRTIPTEPVVLGKASIGDGSALGGVTDVLCGGLAATLVATEPLSPRGQPWQEEAARRVRELILPQILDSDMSLSVTLVIRDRPSHLQLSPSSFLGMQPLQSGAKSTKVLIFDGPIQETGALTKILGQPIMAPGAVAAEAPQPKQLIDAAAAPRHGTLPAFVDGEADASALAAADEYLARLP